MTGIKIKYLERWADHRKIERLYFRKDKGPRTPLRGPVGSPEFWEDYQAAAKGGVQTKSRYKRTDPNSMRWLVEQYYESSAFSEISEGYQKTRRGILDNFCEQHGDKRFSHLESKHIRKIRDDMKDRHGAANNLLKALRQVFKNAVNLDYVQINPLINVERLKTKNKEGIHAWTDAEMDQFRNRHPIGTKAHLAFALLLYTAQRRSDVVKMGRQHIRDGMMNFIQQKTDKIVYLPILNSLQRVIDRSPTGDLTFLITEYGKPYTPDGFGNWFRDRCDEAGLPQCSAHGLRKSSAAHLADIGCTIHEIMAITGHDSISLVQKYTKSAQQKILAERVRMRVDG